jgi:hypothetical protein
MAKRLYLTQGAARGFKSKSFGVRIYSRALNRQEAKRAKRFEPYGLTFV